MPVSNLQNNIDVLQQKFPHVAHKLTTSVGNLQEWNSYQERIEVDHAWLEAVKGSVEENNLIFVYGFGQGLGIADLLEMYPDRWLFVYEPNERVFWESIEKYDLRALFEHPNLRWLSIGKAQLNMLFSLVSSLLKREMAFVALRYYLENDLETLQQIKQDFIKYNLTFDSNQKTHDHFRELWIRNSLFQIPAILSSPSIEQLANSFPDSTAVIVGSGPSLQKDIDWINKLKPNALIIAAGSSIQALVAHGIEPHLTVLMDGNEINTKIFANPKALESPMMFTSSAYHKISEQKSEHKIFSILTNDTIAKFYLDRSRHQMLLSSTPTVTGIAMQAAIVLGAKKIVMMGQDLSFPDNKYYADGVNHRDDAEDLKSAHLKVKNVHGGYNLTDNGFLMMKDSIENLIASCSNIEFINGTRDGAAIEGAAWKPLEEIYEMIKHEHIEDNPVRKLIERTSINPDSDEVSQVTERIRKSLADTWVMREEVQQLQKLLGKIEEWSRTKPAKASHTLVEIENRWAKIIKRDWFEIVSEFTIPLELGEFDKQLPSIVTEKNIIKKCHLIYQHLGELAKAIMKRLPELESIFSEAIARIEDSGIVTQQN